MTVIITSVVAAYAVLYQSHKIAGPLFRFKAICKDITQGNYQPLSHLRKSDQLIDLASSFQEMLQALKNKQDQKEKMIKETLLIADNIKKEQLSDNAMELLNELALKIEQLKTK